MIRVKLILDFIESFANVLDKAFQLQFLLISEIC